MNNSLAEVHPELVSGGRRKTYRLHPMTLLSVQIKSMVERYLWSRMADKR